MKHIQHTLKRSIQAVALAMTTLPLSAQTVHINIDNATFIQPLIEHLASEYEKVEPSFSVQFVSGGSAGDATIALSGETDNVMARYFILPVANAEAEILKEKKIQKGVNYKVAHELFVERSVDDQLDHPDQKQLPGTVYSLSGRYAESTSLLAQVLKVPSKNIRGKKILGREENVLTIVRNRQDAISVNAASLVYDLQTREPVSGVAVLPIDLDGNNKVSDEERRALANLDLLTAYLDNTGNALPTANINVRTTSPSVSQFIDWVATKGQHYLAHYGYLRANSNLTAQK